MNILVCITSVPDTTAKITFTDNDTKLNKAGVQLIIGPYDDYALSRAVELKEQAAGKVTVLHVGGADADPQIRKALALGADEAIRVDVEPADSYDTAVQIAHIARQNSYDLILMGRESIDYNSGIVHGLVAEMLDLPSYSPVMKLDINGSTATITREIDGGKEVLEASLPLVLGCQEPIAEWKSPSMKGIMTARTKPLQVVPPVETEQLSVTGKYTLPAPKGACKMIPADAAETLIRLLQTEAKVI
ncbi:electron transfer flavoprotein subunit beta/FixA family protein [Dyadobacter sandarakinus]|uniref:Electron transfer flavoprotein subunit beta n=1 Tax=Dyadobacter sandarakinus TaxID=2747268 RepID=A0ABX7I354_9BACT|nr:electron transfer flavoprotein subunit beta/FixA family protein [Dyadobacter sandarakinus]QRR00512.1 electron transfer flavoprotein subunit beta/FixA family protein [Dyadobacter sandarakinus]